MFTAILKFIKFVERLGHYFQGKGYGTSTLNQEFRLLSSFLEAEPKLIIDIGGNCGDYSEIVRNKYPLAEIYIFEPSKKNIDLLTSRFDRYDSVTVVPVALSNFSGDSILYANESGSGLGSLTKRRLEHFDVPFDFEEKVHTERFEDYWKNELGGRTIDCVKIDVEGHELDLLKGFGQSLTVVKAIQFEFGGCNIDTRTFFQDFWYFFKSYSFDIYRIGPLGAQPIVAYSELDEFFSTTNFIAVNRNLK